MKQIRVRFAPSPTGFLHIGGLRTALYDYLFAKALGGACILRIEDTDQSRLVPGATENLISSLHSLGLDYDEGPGIGGDFGPYVQSQRLQLYQQEAARLVASGDAYHCFCTAETLSEMRTQQQERKEFVKYDRRCLHLDSQEVAARIEAGEKHVLRLKMPDERIFAFDDHIRGRVEMDANQSDDQVLLKSDGFPTYHLAAVVDDHYMQISHVIRGEEWLSSTPKHIWLYERLGWKPPEWVHLPLILNPDRSKLSKRMNDVSVESYLQKGYLPEALLNFIALLGWHPADDRELYSLEELCQTFSLERVSKAGAVFDLTKLDWMNGHYLRSLPLETVIERSKPYFEQQNLPLPQPEVLELMVEAARERSQLLPQIAQYCRIFISPAPLSEADTEVIQSESSQKVLMWWAEQLPSHFPLNAEKVDALVKEGIAATGLKGKAYYTPLRLALIGQPHGPDMPTTFAILGDDNALGRIQSNII
ncbi:MAG: glutamate--tRNA ligase [Candidatus Cloacimonetes bacterium]|nr:glutamate--tRNA ligase [Candidatus Cloacimonadota bacterium]